MGGTRRLPLARAKELASELLRILQPACTRIAIAGSIRREKADIGDIELVCIPDLVATEGPRDLFGEAQPGQPINRLDELCARLLDEGTLAYRLNKDGKRAWGSDLKWGTFWPPKSTDQTAQGFAVDIYSASVETWAVTMVLRTGPADFSKRLVTPRSQGGMCPDYLKFKGWQLRRRRALDDPLNDQPLDTPDEESVFAALQLPYIPPELRSDTWTPRPNLARS